MYIHVESLLTIVIHVLLARSVVTSHKKKQATKSDRYNV